MNNIIIPVSIALRLSLTLICITRLFTRNKNSVMHGPLFYLSTQSNLFTRLCTRHLRCFVLKALCSKTKHLRRMYVWISMYEMSQIKHCTQFQMSRILRCQSIRKKFIYQKEAQSLFAWHYYI